jgi:hypothetical protein
MEMSTCNQVDLESLGPWDSWPTMPKDFPGTGAELLNLIVGSLKLEQDSSLPHLRRRLWVSSGNKLI